MEMQITDSTPSGSHCAKHNKNGLLVLQINQLNELPNDRTRWVQAMWVAWWRSGVVACPRVSMRLRSFRPFHGIESFTDHLPR